MASNDETGTEVPFPPLKDLASSDPTLRRLILRNLLTHLSTAPNLTITPLQSLQIWRPLFSTLSLHDPRSTAPLSTQTLITTLTTTLLHSTIPRANPHLKRALTAGFWETLAKEWGAIDRHRVDKFLLLTRCMLRAMFGLLYESTGGGASEGEREAARAQVDALGRWPFSSGRAGGGGEGRKVPDGVRYHCLDVWVDELETVLRDGDVGEQGEENGEKARKQVVVGMVMGLVEGSARDALTKGVRIRAKESLADERLKEWK